MGKNLKGKELGEGLCQRKDGRYVVRFTGKNKKKYEKYFQELKDAKAWLEDMRYTDSHNIFNNPADITMNEWFHNWIDNFKTNHIKKSTLTNYTSTYRLHIQPILGDMQLKNVKSIHCQMVVNTMIEKNYTTTTIKTMYFLLASLFEAAINNDLISASPCTKIVDCKGGKQPRKRDALTLFEQKKLLQSVKGSKYDNVFGFILQTGLRIGELSALTWDDVDFNKKTINVNKNMQYISKTKTFYVETPKTQSGKRVIPLTDEAIRILNLQKVQDKKIKIKDYKWGNNVFLNDNGLPILHFNCDSSLNYFCKVNNMRTISVHLLRHTFATRCIEGGMKPKTLQVILGHSNISVTMNLYVHITDDEKESEINRVANYLSNLA